MQQAHKHFMILLKLVDENDATWQGIGRKSALEDCPRLSTV
jgi:hypothetical protein